MRGNKNSSSQTSLLSELNSNNIEILLKINQILPKRCAKADKEMAASSKVMKTCKYARVESLMKEATNIGVLNDILFLLISNPDQRKHYVLMVDGEEASVALKIQDTPLMPKEDIMQLAYANENSKKNRMILASV